MAIFKSKLSENYVTLPNVTIQDIELSWEARGLLAFMLSLPTDWAIYKEWLAEQSAMCGKDKLNRILDELIVSGYLVKQQKRSGAGKFAENDWLVYSEKQPTDELNTADGSTVTGKPVNGEPAATKETSLQSKQSTKETVNTKEKAQSERKPFCLPEKLNLDAWSLWNEYRKQQGFKPYKQVALGEGAAASKLIELAGCDPAKQLAIVNQSISNQWKGLFSLKTDQQQKPAIRQSGFTASENPSCTVGKI
jgi:hypothetical protein